MSEKSLLLQTKTKLEQVRKTKNAFILHFNEIKVSEENKANKEELKQLRESKRKLEQDIEKVRFCPTSCLHYQLALASCYSQLIIARGLFTSVQVIQSNCSKGCLLQVQIEREVLENKLRDQGKDNEVNANYSNTVNPGYELRK